MLTASVVAQVEVGPQVRIDLNGGTAQANETSIASSNFNPNEIVAAWNDWREVPDPAEFRVAAAVSSDGGATWDDWVISLPPPLQWPGADSADPMTAYDDRTGTLWVGGITRHGAADGLFVAKKIPGENDFEPSVWVPSAGRPDKGWMAAGPSPTNPNATSVYIACERGLYASEDMGTIWTHMGVWAETGHGFLPRVGPNGELYVAYWDEEEGLWLLRSFDGGETYDDGDEYDGDDVIKIGERFVEGAEIVQVDLAGFVGVEVG